MGKKSTSVLREDDRAEPLPPDRDAAAQQLADELAQAVHGELVDMVRLLQDTDPAALFGQTEFTVRARALRIATKAYQQRLAQKKTVAKAPA